MPADARYADLVVRHTTVITMDQRRPAAEALAVRAGHFIAVGSNDHVADLIGPGTRVLDLPDSTVIPGLIDAHIHVLSAGVRHITAADCDRRSISGVQGALREFAARTKPGDWVQGFKFDDTKTAERRFLNKTDLDAVSTAHPIYVSHRAGHVYYANSLALERANYHDGSSDPQGGRLGRDDETGELNGVIYERAAEPIRSLLPAVPPSDRREGLRLIGSLLTRAGLTSAHDAMVSSEDLVTYQEGWAAGELPLRIYTLLRWTHMPAARDAGFRTGFGNAWLRMGGIKYVADGAIAARTAYLTEPYSCEGCEHDYGIEVMNQEELNAAVLETHRAGFQVCIHANGDASIQSVLTAYENAQHAIPRHDARHRIEHCTVVNPQLLDRMKRLGVVATPFCTYIYHHGEKMPFYGEQRLQWMFAQRSFLDYGIIATGATDYPPGPYEPLLGIQACVTRTDQDGNVWGEKQRVSVEEALRIYTLHGAYASFEEAMKGSIEPGKLADFTVLGQDPRAVDPLTIKDIPVQMTVIGGTAVHEA